MAAIATLLASCSEDGGNNDNQDFFETSEGSLWVYKRYYVSSTGAESTNGEIDSVRVTGQQVVDGETYFNFNHKVYNASGFLTEERDELLRVNDEMHLVNQNGLVIHPGTDTEYQYTRPQEPSSTMSYQLSPAANVTVEGEDYEIYPYVGYFTPGEEITLPQGIGEQRSYQPGIGMIVYHCRYVNSIAYFEDRLIHYELN